MRFTSKFYALIAVTSIILLVVFYTNSNEPTKDYKAVGAKRYQSLNAQSIERLHDGSNPKRIKVNIAEKPPEYAVNIHKKRAVIILTNHRSGSSFFGQLFNQHSDSFYLFEPLFPLTDSFTCDLNNKIKANLTRDLTQCKLPDWKTVLQNVKEHVSMNNHNLRDCLKNNCCFRGNTKELCDEKFCQVPTSHNECVAKCKPLSLEAASKACRAKPLVVLKIIRICDINLLKPALTSPDMDVKILHLVRDARGIARSRRNLMPLINITASIEETCRRQYNNYLAATKDQPEWLKGKYKIFRYEDLALNPYEKANEVYNFVGLPFTDQIKEWIRDNTQMINPDLLDISASQHEVDEMFQIIIKLNKKYNNKLELKQFIDKLPTNMQQLAIEFLEIQRRRSGAGNPYATSRNSKDTVERWKLSVQYKFVKQIESVCNKAIKSFGYISVDDETQFNNKTNSYIGTFNH